ncbi:MAG TPA: MFS transporter [Acidimicrobiales bacterium]|nr:MFS transporter [Acidimicrobiales bacterium]
MDAFDLSPGRRRRPSGPPPPEGWRPLAPSPTPGATATAPFARLARAHAFSSAGDTLIAMALAGSLFFSISPDAARTRVALYLVLTMAPFAVVAPLIGPWIDRKEGGRRSMVVLSAAIRAVLCLVMADSLDSLLLFPLAFAVLVLGKGYQVARVSLVPGLVRDESELVEANSKLTLISGIVGFIAAIPGVVLLQLGSPWVLLLAALVFCAGTVAATRIPPTAVAPEVAGPEERAELRSAGILLAASAMAVLRGVVGFLAFFAAFYLRGDDAPAWWFGVVLGASAVGALLGASVAPFVRRHIREERILLSMLALVSFGALLALNTSGRESVALLAGLVGVAASAGKLSFDSIVQRDAPDANQGRSFARFETRFQLVWVAGAFLPVVIPLPLGVGYTGMAVTTAVAAFLYATGRKLSAPARVRASVASGTAEARRRWRERLPHLHR